MINRITAVWRRREVLGTLVQRDLRVRYSRSILGYVWTVLDPLLMAAVYFVVFTFVFKAGSVADTPYFLYLLSGLLGWQWFTGSVNDTTKSLHPGGPARPVDEPSPRGLGHPLRDGQGRRVHPVPADPRRLRHLLPGPWRRWTSTGSWSSSRSGVLIQFVLLVGLGLVLAPITVLATDMQRVVRIVLRFFFYLSPILYGVHAVPEKLRALLLLNPLNGILSLYRGGLFERPVSWLDVGVSAAISVALVVLGLVVFSRLERAVLKEI